MSIKVTIGLPVYNVQDTIKKTLDSINDNIEYVDNVIILDNASTDNTVAICNSYCEKDRKFKLYINEMNIGGIASSYKLCDYISGQYYMQLSDGDVIPPGFIGRLLEKADNNNACVYANGHGYLFGEKRELKILNWDSNNDDPKVRVLGYLDNISINLPFYGIMRSEYYLKAVSLIQPYTLGYGWDILVTAYLAMLGNVECIQEDLIEIKLHTEKTLHRYRRYNYGLNYGKEFVKKFFTLFPKEIWTDMEIRKINDFFRRILVYKSTFAFVVVFIFRIIFDDFIYVKKLFFPKPWIKNNR